MMRDTTPTGFRQTLATFAENLHFQRTITVLIIVNAVTLGLETSKEAMEKAGSIIETLDRLILAVFVMELSIRIVAH